MWIPRPRLARTRYFSLPIIFILACSITSFGRTHSGHGNGHFSPSLSITGIAPSTGPTSGGTVVTITGTGFWHSTSVAFGGTAATSVTYLSSNELQAVTPTHTSGAVTVSVTSGRNQSATLAGGFTYSGSTTGTIGVSSISPTQGPASGGTVVTVNGSGFQTGATVMFGSTQSSTVTIASSTQLDAMSPPENAGTVGITVTDPNAQSSSLPSAFTYTSGPSVSSVSPTSGPVTGGTTVTILGSGFQSGSTVAFGSTAAASVTFVSSTEIQVVSPSSTAGTVAISVANSASQTSTLSAAFTFFHIVNLSWAASTSTVTGYNVYRSSTSGGPYTKLNSTSVPGTSFTDESVQAGQTYFYVTTAVNSSNQESVYSNQASAVVPSP